MVVYGVVSWGSVQGSILWQCLCEDDVTGMQGCINIQA